MRCDEKEPHVTEVKDFFMAVYLLAVGETLHDLRSDPEEVFGFADSPSLAERIATYRADTALVNPKAFAREIMKLRKRLQESYEANQTV